MFPLTAVFLLVISASVALRIQNCNVNNNPGVYDEFGPLPQRLYNSNQYYQVDTQGRTFSEFTLRGELQQYMLEYYEYHSWPGYGNDIYAFYKLMYNDGIQYRILDYIRVNHLKWFEVDRAIIDADSYANVNMILRVKFMLYNCNCAMRVYDLNMNDVVFQGKPMSCDENYVLNSHLPTHNPAMHLSYSTQLKNYGSTDLVPSCKPYFNNGVFNEFGHLPQGLFNHEYYRKDIIPELSYSTIIFENPLARYKVEYTKYIEQIGIDYNVYGYHTLYYNDAGMYRLLDYLRVHSQKWRNVQYAILDAPYIADTDYKLRIMFLTQECLCVLRVYDLSASDIPGYAKTYACDGIPISTIPHTVSLGTSRLPTFPAIRSFAQDQRYPGCLLQNNNGVLDTFGPLPTDLKNYQLFYEVVDTEIRAQSKQNLYGKLASYLVEYKEYREQHGFGTYAYLALNYNAGSSLKLLDYIRVNAMKWKLIQSAILNADPTPTNTNQLRVSFLTADCNCVMRVYDLSAVDIVDKGRSMSCDGVKYFPTTSNTRKTLRDETEDLIRFHKTTYKNWSQFYTPLGG